MLDVKSLTPIIRAELKKSGIRVNSLDVDFVAKAVAKHCIKAIAALQNGKVIQIGPCKIEASVIHRCTVDDGVVSFGERTEVPEHESLINVTLERLRTTHGGD